MRLALPELPLSYRYPLPSALLGGSAGRRLRLATSGGPSANPRFFEGYLLQPLVAADLLLTLGDVARARFYTPARMLQRILELADPVATCADERLRFEAFSACASVYARVDLTPEAFDGEIVGRGTTNIDLGADLRAALAGMGADERLALAIGASQVEVRTARAAAVERRVPLPSRWLQSFLEVQAIAVELDAIAQLDARGARTLLRSLPKTSSRRPVWLAADGRAVRLVHHDPGGGAPRLTGLERLRLLERVGRHIASLRILAGADGTTGWLAQVKGGAQLTLIISPEAWRGFSGEGRTLHRLADSATASDIAAVRAALGWQAAIDASGLAAATGLSDASVDRALAALATSGLVGYDPAESSYFRRELPFDLERVERLQPRLRDARRLVAQGSVRVDGQSDGVEAWVLGAGGVEYRVRSGDDGWRCTCPWFGQHRGARGPCKHVLAVQIETADEPG